MDNSNQSDIQHRAPFVSPAPRHPVRDVGHNAGTDPPLIPTLNDPNPSDVGHNAGAVQPLIPTLNNANPTDLTPEILAYWNSMPAKIRDALTIQFNLKN
jgi:hypothetical protein